MTSKAPKYPQNNKLKHNDNTKPVKHQNNTKTSTMHQNNTKTTSQKAQ